MNDPCEILKLDRKRILRDAHVATAAEAVPGTCVADQLLMADILTKVFGRRVYVVTWPIGIVALVDSTPGTAQWDDLLFQTFKHGLMNERGSVSVGG